MDYGDHPWLKILEPKGGSLQRSSKTTSLTGPNCPNHSPHFLARAACHVLRNLPACKNALSKRQHRCEWRERKTRSTNEEESEAHTKMWGKRPISQWLTPNSESQRCRTSLFRSPCDLGLLAPYDLSEASSAKILPSMQVSWNVRWSLIIFLEHPIWFLANKAGQKRW